MGSARLLDRERVEVELASGEGKRLLGARQVIIATGTRTIELPDLPVDGERVLGAREALDLKTLPRRLAVIGGGYIGMELGMAFARLGSEVTVVELLDRILTGTDPDCVKWVERRFQKLGGRILVRSRAAGFEEHAGELHLRVTDAEGRGGETVVVDKILVAVGFRPHTAGLGLEALGVALDGRGHIQVDERCRTSVDGIYAIGDVTGPPYLAHRASRQGIVAADTIAGKQAAMDVRAMPAVVFTDPEIATVGLSAEQAEQQGYRVKVGRFPFSALGRALIYGEQPPPGLVKLVVDAESGVLLGAQIAGHGASDLIAELALALEMGALAEDIALTVHAHPTLPEAIMEAAEAALGHAIHAL
ncbi:MAG: hypothetical protein KatS3mg102_2406 [Planctomycetota bacterium]|nr:MAG: hypothetical protein KatS3mg102_2406 [Planctomycetota bacterium]